MRIGLLGGSFNPAHDGHLHISEHAKDQLNLDQIWWLVSPQNPMKPVSEMAPFQKRFDFACEKTKHLDWLKVKDYEKQFDPPFTEVMLRQIHQDFSDHQFALLLGADNWQQLHIWEGPQSWQSIFESAPVVIFPRNGMSGQALKETEAAKTYQEHYYTNDSLFLDQAKPAWTTIDMEEHPASATQIRATTDWLKTP